MKITTSSKYNNLWFLRNAVENHVLGRINGVYGLGITDKEIECGEKFIRQINKALKKTQGHDCGGGQYGHYHQRMQSREAS